MVKNAALYAGAASALAVGLVLGVAMRPHLGTADGVVPELSGDSSASARPAPVAAAVAAPAASDKAADFAGYSGKLPDYVNGTDWKRLTAAALVPPAAPRSAEPTSSEPAQADSRSDYVSPLAEDPTTTPTEAPAQMAADGSGAAAAPPSAATGTASDVSTEAAAWAAALPPAALPVDNQDEAPPEATGDTRIDR